MVLRRGHTCAVTSIEVYRVVQYAKPTFRDGSTLAIGDKKVEIVNPGGAYETAALFFPAERVLYGGSNPSLLSGGFSVGDADPRDMLAWLRGVATLSFDTIVTARGDTVTRADFDVLVQYADELFAASVEAYTKGLAAGDAQAIPALDKHVGTPRDAQRRTNVAAIFDSLQVRRTDIHAAGIIRWAPRNAEYCAAHDSCESGGRISGGSAGVRIAMSRLGAVAEVTLGDQFISHRESELYDDAFAHRSSRGSFLFRYGAVRPTDRSYDLLFGATLIVTDTRGVARVKQGFAPFAGRRPIAERSITFGVTSGINFVSPITPGMSIFVPVRVTFTPSAPIATWPSPLDVQAGIGLSFRVSQRVR